MSFLPAAIAALLAAALLGLGTGAVLPAVGLAQCPMCGKSAEYAGSSPGEANRTLAAATALLITPALGILGGIAALLWRHRGGGRGGASEETSSGDSTHESS